MPYKRFSPPGYTFLVAHFEPILGKMGFFNTHTISRQQSRVPFVCRSLLLEVD
jgi:hypothetical protein